MSKDWADIVKTKLDSFTKRKREISIALNDLKMELGSNIPMDAIIADNEELVWKINIRNQRFFITEEEIAKKQTIVTTDSYGGIVDTGEKVNVKEALQNIIIEKIKSF